MKPKRWLIQVVYVSCLVECGEDERYFIDHIRRKPAPVVVLEKTFQTLVSETRDHRGQ